MMLSLPVVLISSMGVSAAITVFMAVAAALTLQPALLLTFPEFFGASRRWGITFDGCCVSCRKNMKKKGTHTHTNTNSYSNTLSSALLLSAQSDHGDSGLERSCWTACGNGVQRFVWPIIIVVFAAAVPLSIYSLPRLQHR